MEGFSIMKIKLKKIMIPIVLAAMLMSGCAQTVDTSVEETAQVDEQKDNSVDVIRLATEDWGQPSPFTHYSRGPGSFKMQMVFDSLLERDEKGLIPWMAKSYQISEDGLEYTFLINDGIKWHDGQDLTLEDIKFSFDYFVQHPPVSNAATFGGKEFIKDIRLGENNEITFVLEKKSAIALETIGKVRIIPKHIWENVADPNAFMGPKAVIGCGPYKLIDYNMEQATYEFEAFEDYYGPKPLVKKVQFAPVSDSVLAFENEEIDMIGIGSDLLDRYKSDSTYKVIENPAFWGYRLVFNMEKRPEFKDVKTRQAVAYALDINEMIEKIERGAAKPGSSGYLPPDHVWYNKDVPKYDFDLEKSKELLEGKQINVDFLVGNSSNEIKLAELMKISLEKVGIIINIKPADTKTRDAAVKNGDFEMAIIGHGGWGADANMLKTSFFSGNKSSGSVTTNVIPGYENDAIKELGEQQASEMDVEKRKEMIFEMQKLIGEDLPMIALYYTSGYTVYRPEKYDGWMNMFDHHSLEHSKLSYLQR